MTTKTKTKTVSEPKAKVQALEAELAEHSQKLQEAIDNDDAAAILDLHRRTTELPVHIAAAKVEMIKASIAGWEAKAAVADAESEQLVGPMQAAEERFKAAKTEYEQAQWQYRMARETAREYKHNAASSKRELEQVRAELRRLSGAMPVS